MKFIISLIFIVLYMSCTNNKENKLAHDSNLEIINIDCRKITLENLYIDEFIEDPKVLALETTDNSLIAEISKVIIEDDRIYIIDNKSRSVFLFDIDGKFLKKINRIGRAGDEYIGITDVEIINDELFIYDHMTCKLLSFNKEDFSFIGSVFVSNIWGHNLMNINNSLFFINNRSDSDLGNYFIFKLNENKDFTSYLPFSENIKSWSLDQYCAKGDSCGYFYFPPFDTIYIYKEENAYPKYFVNFGNDKMQNSIITGDPTDALLESSKSDKIIGINKIVPLECKMLINYTFNNGNYFTVYDIDNKNISTYKYVLNEKYQFPLNDVSRADDFLVADISAETFLFYYDIIIKENKMDANSLAEINRILNSINGESNPVLFFAKINN